MNNWSSDRDEFILNIRNQFFIDGKPVTNEEYLTTMKGRGYFSDNCP
jgi:formylglycine-generating enzyme required for sulfatase activity